MRDLAASTHLRLQADDDDLDEFEDDDLDEDEGFDEEDDESEEEDEEEGWQVGGPVEASF